MTEFALGFALAALAALTLATGVFHAAGMPTLSAHLDAQGVVPRPLVRPLAIIVAATELGIAAMAALALTVDVGWAAGGLASVAAVVVGLAFIGYIARAQAVSAFRPCGCSPFAVDIARRAALVPGGGLVVLGLIGSIGVASGASASWTTTWDEVGSAAILPVLAGVAAGILLLVAPSSAPSQEPAVVH
jgi:hypothetical protein